MQDTPGRRVPRRWLRSVSVASRLAMAVVVVSLVSLVVATFVGLRAGKDLTQDLVDERLISAASTGATDVAAQMESWRRIADSLALSPSAVGAIEEFRDAYDELASTSLRDARSDLDDLIEASRERSLDPLTAAGVTVGLRDVLPEDEAGALLLQKSYAVVPDGVDDPAQIDDARDGTQWSEVHSRLHPVYRDVVERQRLVDLLLVEPRRSVVVYSYGKNADLGTSLRTGPFGGSVVAAAVDQVLEDPGAGSVITDLSRYTPTVLTPVGAVASPVMDGANLVGVLVLLYDSEPLTDLLTAGGDWEARGFPESGEAFLIAADGTMRSEPRSFVENPLVHIEAAVEQGSLTDDGRRHVEEAGTVVLDERAVGETVEAAVDGDEPVAERSTSTGEPAFSTARRVDVAGPEWYVVAEVERSVADGELDEFARWLVVGTAIFVVLVAFAAVAWSGRVLAPVRIMSERLRTWSRSTETLEVPRRSPRELAELIESFASMLRSLQRQQAELDAARAQRVERLRSLLPPQVAERVANGDLESVEDVSKVSVAVVVVVGLGALVRTDDLDGNRGLVERLHGELDELGERHGLERIKIVGDSYYAACGHDRPFIDHAPRAIAFAADAQDAIREIGRESGHSLDIVAGIDTGSVHVGLTRATGLVYDVWGATVSRAHNLARLGRRGQILVTDQTRALLPDSIESAPLSGDDEVHVVLSASVGGLA